jgi:ankyrin repeat protein
MEVTVPALPSRPNLDHLKKQAKDLLRLYEARDPRAFERLRASLPAARDTHDAALAARGLRLHDMQSCVAREYGFPSWDALRAYVEHGRTDDPSHLLHRWLNLVYQHDAERPRPDLAARMLAEKPDLVAADPIFACAVGDEDAIRRALAQPDWVHRTPTLTCPDCGAAIGRPPLVAVAHSSLVRLDPFRDRLHRAARVLLDAGADPNQSWLAEPNVPLSALYGAAGLNHDPEMTRLLLDAGATPNDNESLYHSTESGDHTCLTLLLDAGAIVEGTNALHHQLDKDDLDGLRLLLAHAKDVSDTSSPLGSPVLWAIRRGRSAAHVRALLDAGANPRARTKDGVSTYLLASRYGLHDVVELLAAMGAGEKLSIEDQFVAACARHDAHDARRLKAVKPDVIDDLSGPQLLQLPNLAATGHREAVMLMVELGWPITVRGGDWHASALNHAVFRGDATLARFLLEHGASWTERHGHGDNVSGTLSWASRNRPTSDGDWIGCAQALVDHGMPLDLPQTYGDDVADYIATLRAAR